VKIHTCTKATIICGCGRSYAIFDLCLRPRTLIDQLRAESSEDGWILEGHKPAREDIKPGGGAVDYEIDGICPRCLRETLLKSAHVGGFIQ